MWKFPDLYIGIPVCMHSHRLPQNSDTTSCLSWGAKSQPSHLEYWTTSRISGIVLAEPHCSPTSFLLLTLYLCWPLFCRTLCYTLFTLLNGIWVLCSNAKLVGSTIYRWLTLEMVCRFFFIHPLLWSWGNKPNNVGFALQLKMLVIRYSVVCHSKWLSLRSYLWWLYRVSPYLSQHTRLYWCWYTTAFLWRCFSADFI